MHMAKAKRDKGAKKLVELLKKIVLWYESSSHGGSRAVASKLSAARDPLMEVSSQRGNYSVWPRTIQQIFGIDIYKDDQAAPFISRAKRYVEAFENLTREREQETVYISTIDAGASIWIADALCSGKFLAKHPKLNLDIRVREWWQVIEDVRNGIADFGIATTAQQKAVDRIEFLDRPHVAFIPAKSSLAKEKAITPEHLDGKTIVCLHSYLVPFGLPEYLSTNGVNAQLVSLPTCSQIISWITRTSAIAILPGEMLPSGYKALPLNPKVLDASDSIYVRKKKEKEEEEQPRMPESAELALNEIRKYWAR
jgi:DNA-binding transcriptional LysR family regulator